MTGKLCKGSPGVGKYMKYRQEKSGRLRDLTDLLELMGQVERERWEERMAIKCEGDFSKEENAAKEIFEEMGK